MEGYDGRRVLAALDIPDRYAVVMAVSVGEEDQSKKPAKPSWRLPSREVFFLDRFGQPAIEDANSEANQASLEKQE